MKEKNSTIDMDQLKDFHSTDAFFSRASAAEIAIKMENIKILQSILSRQLPSERYNGIINSFYVFMYQNATSEEIESALVMNLRLN